MDKWHIFFNLFLIYHHIPFKAFFYSSIIQFIQHLHLFVIVTVASAQNERGFSQPGDQIELVGSAVCPWSDWLVAITPLANIPWHFELVMTIWIGYGSDGPWGWTCDISLLKEISGKMTQIMKRTTRRSPRFQTVNRKRKKLDPDGFLLEGKSVARPGHQTATHGSNNFILSVYVHFSFFPYFFFKIIISPFATTYQNATLKSSCFYTIVVDVPLIAFHRWIRVDLI